MPARPGTGVSASCRANWSRATSAVAALALLATTSCSLTSDLDSLTSGNGAPRKGGGNADGGRDDEAVTSDVDTTLVSEPIGHPGTRPATAPEVPSTGGYPDSAPATSSTDKFENETDERPTADSGGATHEVSAEGEWTEGTDALQPSAGTSSSNESTHPPPQTSRPEDASQCSEAECNAAVTLAHRFSFSNIPAINDSVGGADGTVVGRARSRNGSFVFDGDTYITLPTVVLDSRANVTLEAWFTSYRTRTWERIFDAGESENGAGKSYLFFTPQTPSSSGTMRLTFRAAGEGEVTLDSTAAATDDVEIHVAAVVDATTGSIRLYHNGQLSASGTVQHSLLDVNVANVWLGRSLFSSDPLFEGELNEFRIYDGALSDVDVAASFDAGPDAVKP